VLRALSPLSDDELQGWLDALTAIPPSQWRTSPDLPEVIRQFASNLPLAWLDGNESPFLVVHGEIDEIAPAAEAQVFAQALQAAGVPTTLAILPGMYHRVNEEALHEPLFEFLSQLTTASP
jgi:dipeptidyl aminopeptidase/acylaminoacyl peptidase